MSATRMTGGATAGTTSTTSTKKALWWIVIAIAGIITLIWVMSALRGKNAEIVRFVTESPTDLVEGPPGVFHRRGQQPLVTGNIVALALTGRFFPPDSVISLDGDWQGVTNFDGRKKVITEYVNDDICVEIRLDRDNRKIFEIPPSNWVQRTNLVLPDAKIIEWQIKPGKAGTATVFNRLADK